MFIKKEIYKHKAISKNRYITLNNNVYRKYKQNKTIQLFYILFNFHSCKFLKYIKASITLFNDK